MTEIVNLEFFKAMLEENVNAMENMVKEGFDIDKRDRHGQTVLSQAISFHKAKSALFLLENNADVSVIHNHGYGLAHFALMNAGNDDFDVSILNGLLSAGADSNHKDDLGQTAIMAVIYKLKGRPGRVERILETLLDHGYDPYLDDNAGKDLFDYLNKSEFGGLVGFVLSKLDDKALEVSIEPCRNNKQEMMEF